jgi:hypothetical protein
MFFLKVLFHVFEVQSEEGNEKKSLTGRDNSNCVVAEAGRIPWSRSYCSSPLSYGKLAVGCPHYPAIERRGCNDNSMSTNFK